MKCCSYEDTDPQHAVHLDMLVLVWAKHISDLWYLRFPFNFLICFLINVLNYKKYW